MDQSYLAEYLVGLGFSTDTIGFANFQRSLRDVTAVVDTQYTAMAKKVIEFQSAATGMFGAIGTATLGFADNVAMADQSFRLFGLHMYASLPVARELKTALDALGQPLENVIWDPELAARFHQLVEDQRALTQELGPDFENQMLKIRDVRFEFTRFGVELQYLSYKVVEDLAEAFGTNIDGILEKMRGFNAWFIQHMPEISNWIATKLAPVLKDVANIFRETEALAKAFGVTFTNLVGVLSGDKTLEGQTFSWDKFGTAIDKTVDKIAAFTVDIDHAIEMALHLFSAMLDASQLDFKGAKEELSAVKEVGTPGAAGILGLAGGAPVGTAIGAGIGFSVGGPVGAMIGAPIGGAVGGALGSYSGYEVGSYLFKNQLSELQKTQNTIRYVSRFLNIPPELSLAVAQHESNFRQYNDQGGVLTSNVPWSHAMGMFQLQPGTAAEMGVDPTNGIGNIIGGEKYLKKWFDASHGDINATLQHYYGSKSAAENQKYAKEVMGLMPGFENGGSGVSITNHVTVNVASTNASAADIAHHVSQKLTEDSKHKIQRHEQEFTGIY